MLNTQQLNTAQLNSTTPAIHGVSPVLYDDLQFNNYSLQESDGSVISELIEVDGGPTRELPSFMLPRSNGGAFLGDYFRERRVRARGIISAATSALLEQALDTFKQKMTRREGTLIRKQPGTSAIRAITATLVNPDTMFAGREGFHITFCPFDVTFLSLEPWWHALTYTSNDPVTYTGLAENPTVDYDGTADAELVTILIIGAATALTAVTVENTTTGESIAITTSITAGDVIEIDGENKTVKKNGTELDYDGSFPRIVNGINELAVTFTGTSVSYDPTYKYRKTYI